MQNEIICICEKCQKENVLENIKIGKLEAGSWVKGHLCRMCKGSLIVVSIDN